MLIISCTSSSMKIDYICMDQDTVMCRAAKFGCARHCVLFTRTNFQPFSAIYSTKILGRFQSKSRLRCPTVSLPYVSNLKVIDPVVPEIRGSKSCPNFFVFLFFFATLINLFKNNLPLHRIPPNLHCQLCNRMPTLH